MGRLWDGDAASISVPSLPFDRADALHTSPVFHELRERGPVVRVATPTGDPAWLVVAYHQAREAFADRRLGFYIHQDPDSASTVSDAAVHAAPMGGDAFDRDMARLRRLLVPGFTPKRTRLLGDWIQELTDGCLDRLQAAHDAQPGQLICRFLNPGRGTSAQRSCSASICTERLPRPRSSMTIAGIVKHLAWAEDRWFQGRLLGVQMPAPWDTPGADDPDQAMRLASDDTVDGIVDLYSSACRRSRSALARCDSLDRVAAVPSFGIGPLNLRWILIHMIDETARHAGHLDLLRDCLRGG